jgi:hypothetical protein
MVRLRHIIGPNLKQLEKTLEEVKNSIIITGVNNVGGQWYIHFLVQGTQNDNEEIKRELSFGTKTLKKGK